jgi:hypothetical protein
MARTFSNINATGLYVTDGTPAINNAATPNTANTASSLGTITGVARFDELHCRLVASNALAGGTCSYVLQRRMPDNTWDDYFYVGQQTAGTTFERNFLLPIETPQPVGEADTGTDSSWVTHDTLTDGTIVLSAGNGRSGHFGNEVRLIARTGAGVSAAAIVNFYVRGVTY